MSEIVVEARGLSKTYGKYKAVDNVSFSLAKGSLVGLVGKNGAGKTTLIRLMSGLIKPSEGEVALFGQFDPIHHPKMLERVSTMVEYPALYPTMTARENLLSACILKGVKDPIKSGYIKEKLEFVGLGELYDSSKKAKNYSLGMKQRLGIAMAYIGEPELMFLDEPTNGLDPEGIEDVRRLLIRVNERGTTILVSSHILSELSRFAKDYLFMDRGQIVEHISAEELEHSVGKRVYLHTDDDEKLLKTLVERGFHAERSGDGLCVTGVGESADLINLLFAQGFRLLSYREEDNSLEDRFLSLLGGEGK